MIPDCTCTCHDLDGHFLVEYTDAGWRWEYRAKNGRVAAVSPRSFPSCAAAQRAVERFLDGLDLDVSGWVDA